MKIDKYVDNNGCRIACDFEILRHSPIFVGINLDVVKMFAYLANHRVYKEGDHLIEQGKKARQAFLIIKGIVDISVNHRTRNMRVQQLQHGSFFGELALLAEFDWFFNAVADDNTEVLIIERTAFQKVIEKYPEHKDRLIERMIQLRINRLAQQTHVMLDQLLESNGEPVSTLI